MYKHILPDFICITRLAVQQKVKLKLVELSNNHKIKIPQTHEVAAIKHSKKKLVSVHSVKSKTRYASSR